MKKLLGGLILIGIGVILGGFLVSQDNVDTGTASVTTKLADGYAHVLNSNPFVASNEPVTDNVQRMEQRLAMLEQRIEALEIALAETQSATDAQGNDMEVPGSVVDTPVSSLSRVLSIDNLTRAGLDEQLASDIVRRRNQLELQKLELRDRASREGYLGTQRYQNELAALNVNDVSLRDEIGDQAYDRYLYSSGQSNRVKVASVMLGSAAEQSGVESGDLILSYNGQTLFKWAELQQATSEGELGEYVNLGVLRDGVQLTLWLPRGPLGVRLEATRLNPDG